MRTIRFNVDGIPKAQPRPRAFARQFGNGKVSARVYDAGTAEGWKGAVALAARDHRPETPFDGPVYLDIDFIFPRPKSLLRRKDPAGELPHIKKPDRDNCEKAVLDALTSLGFWRDDGQVCGGEVRKFYATKDGRCGARIRLMHLGDQSCDLHHMTALEALKALAEPRLRRWLDTGNQFEVISWRKGGPFGKRKTWEARREPIVLADLPAAVAAEAVKQ